MEEIFDAIKGMTARLWSARLPFTLGIATSIFPQIAWSEDYPFPGIFSYDSESPWTCAYDFSINSGHGNYVTFALDRKKYVEKVKIDYVITNKGLCKTDDEKDGKFVEICDNTNFTNVIDGNLDRNTFYSLVSAPDLFSLQYTRFQDAAERDAYLSGKSAPTGYSFKATRCVGLSLELLAPYLNADEEIIEADYYQKYLSPVEGDASKERFEALAPDIFATLRE